MTSQKEKRGAISAQRRRQLRLLVVELQKLQHTKFQDIRHDIQDAIDEFLRLASRTRETDRQAVLDVLAIWQQDGVHLDEIVDDTGLSERIAGGVLNEFLNEEPPRITVTDRPTGKPGRRAKVYKLARPV